MAATNSAQGPTPSQSPEQLRQAQYHNLLTYTSLGALLLCPALIALPPRKFDFYTILLISGTALGGNQVLREYTGRGITERVPALQRLTGDARLPTTQERGPLGIPADLVRPSAARQADEGLGTTVAVARAVRDMKAAEAQAQAHAEEEVSRRRKADWKVVREEREREALEDGGKGYGGLIMDQIWEVWNWGRESGGGKGG